MQSSHRITLALRLTTLAFVLACVVVSLGAFTRLVHAGLGCPDWPGCYGHLTWPTSSAEIAAAEAIFPESPVETDKTWPEMVHRYFAGTLGLLVLAISVLLFKQRSVRNKLDQAPPVVHGFILLALITLQAAFGMWTVTLKLWPQIVTAHLLGGFTTLCLIWFLRLRLLRFIHSVQKPFHRDQTVSSVKRTFSVLFVLVVLQVSLGGWTSANYAAMACPDLPTCHGQWMPSTDFKSGFNFTQSIGPNYLGGLLDGPARTAIHIAHRAGAILVTLFSIFAIWQLAKLNGMKNYAVILSALLLTQLSLGIANIVFSLPLAVAVAHNAGGALLLLAIITTHYKLRYPVSMRSLSTTRNLSSAQQQLQQTDVMRGANNEPINNPAL